MDWWWISDIYFQYIKNPDVDGVKHGWTRNPLEPEGHLLVRCSGCNHLQSALICCCGLVSIFSCSTSKDQDHWTSWRTHNMFPQRLPSVLLLLSLQSNQMWAHRLKEVPVFLVFFTIRILSNNPLLLPNEGKKKAVLQRKPKFLFNTLGHSQSSFYQVIFGIFQRWTVAFLWATLIFLDRNQCPRSKHHPRILFSQVSSHCHRPARHQKIF